MSSQLFVSVVRANINNDLPTYQGRIECRDNRRKVWVKRTGQRLARVCPDHALQDAIIYANELVEASQGVIADIIITA